MIANQCFSKEWIIQKRSEIGSIDPALLEKAIHAMDHSDAWQFEQRIKNTLSQLKIEDLEQKMSQLSGGQIKRVALAGIILRDADFLILDEPTNHLDIKTKEILKNALKEYDGNLILVSHDRDFLQGLAQKVFEFKDQRVIEHFETIDDFLIRNRIESLKEIQLKG